MRKLADPIVKRVSWKDEEIEIDEKKHKSVNLRDQLNQVTSDLATTQADVQHLKTEHSKVDTMIKWLQTKMDEIAALCSQNDSTQNPWKQELCKLQETQEKEALQSAADMSELKVRVAAWETVESKTSTALRDTLWALEQLRADNDSTKKRLEAVTTSVTQDLKTIEIDLKQSLQNQVSSMRREMRNQVVGMNSEFRQQQSDIGGEKNAKRVGDKHSMSFLELQNKAASPVHSKKPMEDADTTAIDNVAQKVANLAIELEAEVAERAAKLSISRFSCR